MSAQVDFDLDGPHVGGIRLVTKTAFGFVPRRAEELQRISSCLAAAQVDVPKLHTGLLSVARCLNENDLALAAMTASRLAVPVLTSEDLRRAVVRAENSDRRTCPGVQAHPTAPNGSSDLRSASCFVRLRDGC